MAIFKWNETPYEYFKEILIGFAKEEGYAKNRVLEVQEPLGIKVGANLRRTFFGKKINIFDFESYNKNHVELLKKMQSMIPDMMLNMVNGDTMGMCNLDPVNGPKISPILTKDRGMDLVWSSMFGETALETKMTKMIAEKAPCIMWYLKDKDGNRLMDISPNSARKYSNQERMVRFRTIDFDTWKQMVEDWMIEGKDLTEYTKDDLQAKDIAVIPKIAELLIDMKKTLGS